MVSGKQPYARFTESPFQHPTPVQCIAPSHTYCKLMIPCC
jgi:hypothetical protein